MIRGWTCGSAFGSLLRLKPVLFACLASLPLGRMFGLFHADPESKRWVTSPLNRRHLMGKKLYVGNLGYSVTGTDLETMFAPHGTVESAQVITERDTGQSKGFGFVEMSSNQQTQAE